MCLCVGAALKGPFSRYDFQRNSGPSAVKSYTTLLPAAAQDVYYRDEIGNISTSNARPEEDLVSLELPTKVCVCECCSLYHIAGNFQGISKIS